MLGKRIKEARKKLHLSQTEIGKKMGNISKAAVSKWEKGENTPKNIDLLARILLVNVNWLRTGKGSMLADGIPMNELVTKDADEWDRTTPLNNDEVEVPYFKSIELAAGHGCSNMEDYNGFKLRFGKSFFRRKGVQKENVVCFPVKGNSMEPVMPDGATVAVDVERKDIKDGSVYAICQDGLCRLKRLYQLPNNQIRLVSYNAIEYPDEVDRCENIKIIGKVFHCAFEVD